MPKLLKLLTEGTTVACDEISFSEVNRTHAMGWIPGFPLCGFCVFLWLRVVYGPPAVMTAKPVLVFIKQEMCL